MIELRLTEDRFSNRLRQILLSTPIPVNVEDIYIKCAREAGLPHYEGFLGIGESILVVVNQRVNPRFFRFTTAYIKVFSTPEHSEAIIRDAYNNVNEALDSAGLKQFQLDPPNNMIILPGFSKYGDYYCLPGEDIKLEQAILQEIEESKIKATSPFTLKKVIDFSKLPV